MLAVNWVRTNYKHVHLLPSPVSIYRYITLKQYILKKNTIKPEYTSVHRSFTSLVDSPGHRSNCRVGWRKYKSLEFGDVDYIY